MTRILNEDDLHFVYSLLDADGTPIYIGVTGFIGTRLDEHRRRPFWAEVARVEIDVFPTRSAGFAAEAERIRAANPKHNVTHTDRAARKPRKHQTVFMREASA